MNNRLYNAVQKYLRESHNRMLTQYNFKHGDIKKLIRNLDIREIIELAKLTKGKMIQGSAFNDGMNKVQEEFKRGLVAIISKAMYDSFISANHLNNELIKRAYGLTEKTNPELFSIDTAQWKQLENRRLFEGRTLSGRIWMLSNDYKRDIQDAIQIGFANGDSADEIAKRLIRYSLYANEKLIDIDKLTNEEVKRAVSRRNTSQKGSMGTVFKDAKRLAGNETNIAYRGAEQRKWRNVECVLGQEIRLSNAHPREDICDFVNGVYPLWFVWNGWHVNCICYRTPVLMPNEQFLDNIKRRRRGEKPNLSGVVNKVPDNFIDYMRKHYGQMSKWKSKPYFMQDNDIPKIISG